MTYTKLSICYMAVSFLSFVGLEVILPQTQEQPYRYIMLLLTGTTCGAAVSFLVYFYNQKIRSVQIMGNKASELIFKGLLVVGCVSFLFGMAIAKRLGA